MNSQNVVQSPSLRGVPIFLSASVPKRESDKQFELIPDAQLQIEEAVVSLTRAILVGEGTLVFGGHPSISPLVGLVATEYIFPGQVEGKSTWAGSEYDEEEPLAPIQIYQSEAFRNHLPDETWQLFRQGGASIHWVPAVGNERFNPKMHGQPQCPESLKAMRISMLKQTNPTAMVCIGGMEGVIEEAKLYRELVPGGAIYTFETTGGAARILSQIVEGVYEFDREVFNRIKEIPQKVMKSEDDKAKSTQEMKSVKGEISVIPYPLICQLLVRKIAISLKQDPYIS